MLARRYRRSNSHAVNGIMVPTCMPTVGQPQKQVIEFLLRLGLSQFMRGCVPHDTNVSGLFAKQIIQ